MTSRLESEDELRALQLRLSDAEAKIAQVEEWLDLTFETSAVAMTIVSVFEVRYLRINSAMAQFVGFTVDEILAADPFAFALKITHPDDLVAEQKLFAELAIGARRSYQIEKRFVRSDGSIRWGALTISGIYDASVDPATPVGPLRFAVMQVIDVTERVLLAETLARRDDELRHAQRVDSIGRLAAGVAHDFNNLLTVITGHAEMLKRSVGDDVGRLSAQTVREDLDAILTASERAASLTAQLLSYGRREAVMRRNIVLSAAVATSQQLLSRTIESAIEVEQSLAATGSIFADQGQIGQVLMNLVLNARDAIAERGRILVATRDVVVADGIREREAAGPGEWVALIVTDTGHGMSPEVRARMFDPFFTTRADRPGTQGSGLGLATVQRLVTESGGRIDVKSAPGDGTTVTVYFPRVSSTPQEIESPRTQLADAPAPNVHRVLVVEDEPAVRSLIATVLLGAHYRVAVARHGEEALQLIEAEHEPFHLIVTDLVMPGIGGMMLAKHLHERGNQARILFVSGYSSHGPSELLPYGRLLPKPFTPAQLLAAVHKALKDPT